MLEQQPPKVCSEQMVAALANLGGLLAQQAAQQVAEKGKMAEAECISVQAPGRKVVVEMNVMSHLAGHTEMPHEECAETGTGMELVVDHLAALAVENVPTHAHDAL